MCCVSFTSLEETLAARLKKLPLIMSHRPSIDSILILQHLICVWHFATGETSSLHAHVCTINTMMAAN